MAQPDGWVGTKGTMGWEKRNVLFLNAAYPGVALRHCCHPTANYPWFTHDRDRQLRTFRTLAQAKEFVADEFAGCRGDNKEVKDEHGGCVG